MTIAPLLEGFKSYFDTFSKFTISTLPLFILLGLLASSGDIYLNSETYFTWGILLFIFKLLLPSTLSLFGNLEVFFVNDLGLPFNSGTIFSAVFIICSIYYGLLYTAKKRYYLANTTLLSLTFIFIGFSSWLMIPIRSNANTVINENSPKDARSLLAYYNLEQYPDTYLFYGPMFSDIYAGQDPDDPYRNDKPKYERDYVITKLVELTYESWRPICELIYDSHLKPNEFVISVNNLNHFFEVNWETEFLKIIDDLTSKQNEDNDEENDILSDEEDILDDEDELDLDLESLTISDPTNETKENYYKVIDEEIKLTWKGFNTYLTFVVKYMSAIDKLRMLNSFNYKIHTEFINIIKEQRNNLLKLSESQKIWGYKDSDYNCMKQI